MSHFASFVNICETLVVDDVISLHVEERVHSSRCLLESLHPMPDRISRN